MKKLFVFLLLVSFMFSSLTLNVFAGEVDILVGKLVEKGVLTPGEAQQILTETKEEVKKEIAQGKSESLPKWVQNIKFKGDLRLRYQWDKHKSSSATAVKEQRHRGRFRLRFGADAKIIEKVKVGFGLASGSDGDPRSTNQTFQDTFAKKPIWIDYAYASYTPFTWLSLTGGRMKNPIWQTSDLLWDTDINPEGFAAQFNYSLLPNLEVFANNGIFVLDESSGDVSDPYMIVFQPGLKWTPFEKLSIKGAVAGYAVPNIRKYTLDWKSDPQTNTVQRGSGTGYQYQFNTINPSLEIGIKEPLVSFNIPYLSSIPYLAINGDFNYNPSPDRNNIAYLAGFKFGHEKISEKNSWQFKYSYRALGANSWLNTFPDSDFYGGATDVHGHEVVFEYAPFKNFWFTLDYYNANRIHDAAPNKNKAPWQVLQVDANFKF